MIDSLYIAASGMHAQQLNVDVIANNLANVSTGGFKKNRVSFEDLLYRDVAKANGLVGSSDAVYRLGVGTAISGAGKVFTQGDLKKTDAPLDVAVRGQGFFEVVLPDGSYGYTRSGSFQINKNGFLTTADGNALKASVQVPSDAKEIVVQPDGQVLASIPGEKNMVAIGQIELANFVNPSGLNPLGDNLYQPTENSGQVSYGKPSDVGFGSLSQGFIESSNVKLVEEMINLIVAQRAYEINSKVVQASDELLTMSNNLRR